MKLYRYEYQSTLKKEQPSKDEPEHVAHANMLREVPKFVLVKLSGLHRLMGTDYFWAMSDFTGYVVAPDPLEARARALLAGPERTGMSIESGPHGIREVDLLDTMIQTATDPVVKAALYAVKGGAKWSEILKVLNHNENMLHKKVQYIIWAGEDDMTDTAMFRRFVEEVVNV